MLCTCVRVGQAVGDLRPIPFRSLFVASVLCVCRLYAYIHTHIAYRRGTGRLSFHGAVRETPVFSSVLSHDTVANLVSFHVDVFVVSPSFSPCSYSLVWRACTIVVTCALTVSECVFVSALFSVHNGRSRDERGSRSPLSCDLVSSFGLWSAQLLL